MREGKINMHIEDKKQSSIIDPNNIPPVQQQQPRQSLEEMFIHAMKKCATSGKAHVLQFDVPDNLGQNRIINVIFAPAAPPLSPPKEEPSSGAV